MALCHINIIMTKPKNIFASTSRQTFSEPANKSAGILDDFKTSKVIYSREQQAQKISCANILCSGNISGARLFSTQGFSTAATPAITSSADTDSGFVFLKANELGIGTGGGIRVIVNNTYVSCAAMRVAGNILTGSLNCNGAVDFNGNVDFLTVSVQDVPGVDGSFITSDIPPKTVTVTKGIITNIV